MPIDFVVPALVLLAAIGIIFLFSIATAKNKKRRFIVFVAFEGTLLVLFWSLYILPAVLLRSRAEKGDAVAQYGLGRYYLSRLGYLWPNMEESRKWLIKAAESRNVDAMIELGNAYSVEGNVLGVDFDIKKSFHWYTKALDAGYPDASQF